LDSFGYAVNFIVLQISQILVSTEGAAKKKRGGKKQKKNAIKKQVPFIDDGRMNN